PPKNSNSTSARIDPTAPRTLTFRTSLKSPFSELTGAMRRTKITIAAEAPLIRTAASFTQRQAHHFTSQKEARLPQRSATRLPRGAKTIDQHQGKQTTLNRGMEKQTPEGGLGRA